MSDPFSPSPPAPTEPRPAAELSPAMARFKSCRWRRPPEDGPECCGHRDVLPLAGTTGFDPEAWCLDCAFYKLKPSGIPPEPLRWIGYHAYTRLTGRSPFKRV